MVSWCFLAYQSMCSIIYIYIYREREREMWQNNVHSCTYSYIGCMCVGLCEFSWMGGLRKDFIFSIFGGVRLFEGSLCVGYTWEVLAPKIDKEMCRVHLREDPSLEVKKTKDVGQFRFGLRTVWRETQLRRVSRSQKATRGQWRRWPSKNRTSSSRSDDQWTSASFGSCLGFSQRSCDSYIYIHT